MRSRILNKKGKKLEEGEKLNIGTDKASTRQERLDAEKMENSLIVKLSEINGKN